MGVTEASTAAVVICTYTEARWDLIGRAIESVQHQSRNAAEVVLVVDHNDTLLRRAKATWPDVRVVANEEAKGLSGARNTGVAHARAAVVAFLDDDARADHRWLERLLSHFADPHIGGAGGLVRPAWEGRQPSWLPDEFLWVVGCSYTGLPRSVSTIRNPIGANMAFRRSLLVTTGGFSAGVGRVGTLPLGCEETELSIRVRRLGSEIVYDPDAVVDHVVPAERGRFSYFLRRCVNEGRSKAAVSRLVGADSALESERHYVRRTLPAGIVHSLRRGAPRRAAAIPIGLAATAWGYAWSRLRLTPMAADGPDQQGQDRTPPADASDRPHDGTLAGASDAPTTTPPSALDLGAADSAAADSAAADFGAVDEAEPEPWRGSIVRAIDIAGIACAVVLAAFVLADRTSTLRQVLALVFFLVVPGWALLRGLRARPCSLMLMGSVGISLAIAVLGGELMVTELGFPWKGATVLACGLSTMVLVVDVGAARWQ